MNIREIVPQAGQDEALAIIRQLSQAEVLQPYQTERIAKDGRILRVSLTATALVNDGAEMYAVATTERVAS